MKPQSGQSSNRALALPSKEIHVWRLDIEDAAAEWDACLDADEILRANRFKFEKDRRRFAACRATLRRLLGRYLDQPPREIAFEYGEAGKPRLRAERGIRFNLSHSAAACVIAVAKGREVGIDVEKVRALPGSDEIARRIFPPADREALAEIPAGLKQDAFFRLWVRNEAAIKAGGLGFSAPRAGNCVVLDLAETKTRSGDRYVGAVASEGDDWTIHERFLGDDFRE